MCLEPIYMSYGELRSKMSFLLQAHIFILKIQTTDPNRSTFSPYWNVLGDQILHFLEFFDYLLSHFENRWSNGPENLTVFLLFIRFCDFQSGLINSKKTPKNIKFSLQAHFNMKKMLNGSDRFFGFSNWNTSVK